MTTLKSIFDRIGNHSGIDQGCNDKGGLHSYIETYDNLFKPFRNGCTIMELGIALGDSINLFDQYFENSNIVGVDLSIIFQPLQYKNKVELIAADATKASFLEVMKDKTFDIIIDDASHMTQDQIDSFNLLKQHMNKGGIYIIEDILALDQELEKYRALHDNCEIIDMRHTGRFDNVLIIYRF